VREDERGKKGGARRRWGTLYRRRGGVGDGPRMVPRGGEVWGAWDHRGGRAVRRGMADSGPAAALVGGTLTGAARPVPK
jgi:hypothetical protein